MTVFSLVRTICVLQLLAVIGCEDSSFKKSTYSTETAENTPSEEQEILESAMEPQMIGGAFLSCVSLANEEFSSDANSVQLENDDQLYGCRIVTESGETFKKPAKILSISLSLSDSTQQDVALIPAISEYWKSFFIIKKSLAEKILSLSAAIEVEGKNGTIKESEKSVSPRVHTCPKDYVRVDGEVGVQSFCISRFEMKNVNGKPASLADGLPWVSITTNNARAACASLGAGYSLPLNSEWMALASQIERQSENWSSSIAGSGELNRGHSDSNPRGPLAAANNLNESCIGTGQICNQNIWNSQRRTHRLLNGQTIWDFAGNVHELVDWQVVSDKASPINSWIEYKNITPTVTMPASSYLPIFAGVDTSNGIGGYFPGLNNAGGTAQRGGSWGDGINTGIYALALDLGLQTPHSVTGFRCIFRL